MMDVAAIGLKSIVLNGVIGPKGDAYAPEREVAIHEVDAAAASWSIAPIPRILPICLAIRRGRAGFVAFAVMPRAKVMQN